MVLPTVRILPIGAKIEYRTNFDGEDVTLEGVIRANGIDSCRFKSLKDLVYYLEVEGEEKYVTAHHEDVQEIIECECCGEDLLEVGIDDNVWITYTYDKETKTTFTQTAPVLDCDCYRCSSCGAEISDEKASRLREYLDI